MNNLYFEMNHVFEPKVALRLRTLSKILAALAFLFSA